MTRLVLITLALGVLACSEPAVGDDCRTGTAACLDDSASLWCRTSTETFYEVPCRGPAGCVASSERVSCDFSGNIAGDACPPAAEGLGMCSTANAKEVLKCDGGKFIVLATCTNTCVTAGGQVGCE